MGPRRKHDELVFIFDIGGVLIKWRSNDPIFRYIAQRFRVPFQEMKRALQKNFQELESGKIRADEWVNVALSEFNKKMGELDQGDELLLTPFASRATIRYGAAKIIRSIRRSGFQVYALTNTSFVHLEYMRKAGWTKLFDGFYSSCELGCAKPAPQIYRKALKLIGAQPAQVVFVDDKGENVRGAKAAGIKRSIRFLSIAQLRKELTPIVGKGGSQAFLKGIDSERSGATYAPHLKKIQKN
jgi:epoxide hydrolase-like predicted phosphatase